MAADTTTTLDCPPLPADGQDNPTGAPPAGRPPVLKAAVGTGFPASGGKGSVRSAENAVATAPVFLEAIGVDAKLTDFIPEDQRQIVELMTETVLAVAWYGDKIDEGRRAYQRGLLAALAITLGMPFIAMAIGLVPVLLSSSASAGTSLSEVLIALIAGFAATQGILRDAFGRRFRFAAFWTARSKISSTYAGLITRWQADPERVATTGTRIALAAELRSDMRAAVATARAAMAEEEETFFRDLQLPSVDIGAIGTTRAGVAKFFTDAASPAVTKLLADRTGNQQRAAVEAADEQFARIAARIETEKQRLKAVETELAALDATAPGRKALDIEKDHLAQSLAGLYASLRSR
ncbi:hypothetical protein HL658_16950 [Azospirillum sp. RWY-5-1]|uniref:Uncharacterized protein n=1 Tax=Azospirillum oleiclasticum TaxID=2735135 RepID=A0ABX2TBK5_9PROT|nr:hypothetical protein [Azospirillum oleiclasticum]NYZ14246.1 hypothetical protein [Azospirillum oleiclasticum]NYZ21731.1 hypothetical protein [Azospirillum oleiclasticum]